MEIVTVCTLDVFEGPRTPHCNHQGEIHGRVRGCERRSLRLQGREGQARCPTCGETDADHVAVAVAVIALVLEDVAVAVADAVAVPVLVVVDELVWVVEAVLVAVVDAVREVVDVADAREAVIETVLVDVPELVNDLVEVEEPVAGQGWWRQ